MKILIIGDCHGQFLPVVRAIKEARDLYGIEAAIQVGDFGFYPQSISKFLEGYGGFAIPTYVIDGNHEDHNYIACGLAKLAANNLHYCNRGKIVELDGARIGFCGGALNVDRPQEWREYEQRKWKRVLPDDAQEANWLTISDAERAAEAFNVAPLDLLITHSCPCKIGVGQPGSPYLLDGEQKYIRRWGIDPGPIHDVGEPSLTHLWNKLVHKPANWVYGHFHSSRQKQLDQTMFTCVGSADKTDGHDGVLPWVYDTQLKKLELMSTERLVG